MKIIKFKKEDADHKEEEEKRGCGDL